MANLIKPKTQPRTQFFSIQAIADPMIGTACDPARRQAIYEGLEKLETRMAEDPYNYRMYEGETWIYDRNPRSPRRLYRRDNDCLIGSIRYVITSVDKGSRL